MSIIDLAAIRSKRVVNPSVTATTVNSWSLKDFFSLHGIMKIAPSSFRDEAGNQWTALAMQDSNGAVSYLGLSHSLTQKNYEPTEDNLKKDYNHLQVVEKSNGKLCLSQKADIQLDNGFSTDIFEQF